MVGIDHVDQVVLSYAFLAIGSLCCACILMLAAQLGIAFGKAIVRHVR